MTFADIARMHFREQYYGDPGFVAEVNRLDFEWPAVLSSVREVAGSSPVPWQLNLLDSAQFKLVYLRTLSTRYGRDALARETAVRMAQFDKAVLPFDTSQEGAPNP